MRVKKTTTLVLLVFLLVSQGGACSSSGVDRDAGFHSHGLTIGLLSKPTEISIDDRSAAVLSAGQEKIVIFDGFIPKKGDREEIVAGAMKALEQALNDKQSGISDIYDESPPPSHWEKNPETGVIYTYAVSGSHKVRSWYVPLVEKRSVRLLRVTSSSETSKQQSQYNLLIDNSQLRASLSDLANGILGAAR